MTFPPQGRICCRQFAIILTWCTGVNAGYLCLWLSRWCTTRATVKIECHRKTRGGNIRVILPDCRLLVAERRCRWCVIGSHAVVAAIAVVARNACNARIAYNARNADGSGRVQRRNDVDDSQWSGGQESSVIGPECP